VIPVLSGNTRRARILIVDDEPRNRQLLEVMLTPEGFDLAMATSGADALAKVAEQPPDLILLDVMMPDMDGYEVAATLKAEPATKSIPIIMVTVRDDREAKMRGLNAGAEDFLSKPVDRAELRVRVRNLLRLKAYGDYHDKYSQMLETEVGLRTAHLLESEARYRRIVETSNEGVWTLDASGKTSFMNSRMAQMLDCDASEARGRALADFLYDDGLVQVTASLEGTRAGRSTQIEVRLKRADGAALWVLLETSAIFDADRQYEGALAMVMDVSERRKAQEASRASEYRFRRLWDSGLILISISDAAGTLVDLNEASARLLGYSRDELLDGTVRWQDLTAPECKGADQASIAQLSSCGVTSPWEKELLRKDGTRMPILTGAATLENAGRIAIAIDLTERKRAERGNLERMRIAELTAEIGVALTQGGALEEVLQRCADAMVQHAGAACARIWTCDAVVKRLVLHATAGHCSVPSSLVVGQAPIPAEIQQIAESRVPHVTNDVSGDADPAVSAWSEHDGMIAFVGYPMLVSGKLVGVISMFARHALSDATLKGLASVADEIAIGVHRSLGDDIRAGLEGKLRQAQKMEAVGRLAGGVAHDFNNVLSVILSYADLMLETLDRNDPMRDDVDEIRRAGGRAADLTRQLLMFSRQQVLEPKVLDLDDLLARMAKMLQRILGEDVDLVFLANRGLGRLRADPSSIEQVVMNLVVNARDAMPTGGKLTIETANVQLDEDFVQRHGDATPGPYIMLAVSDTGIGMDAATRSRIFEPFFTTKPVDKGTGLGLSTVFGIAQQSGGCVHVESEPGAGTTFKLYLPRVDCEIDTARSSPPAPSRRGTETVLLVDDDEQVRLVARGILKKSGYQVIDAASGGEALLVCEQHRGAIHLLLTDVVMPQMSGPELARRLAESRPGMRVMCMSGYTDDSIVRHGVLGTEIAYLQKPFTPESLTRKVREVLDA
jgi:two-component system cell cycle sensor histidine kinase/response regulator CckA